ncbi:MAG: hypothetical protein M0P13_09425 [Fibrobacteraceae bacterium]|jgi:hypothetical protein|nr:hypothetical protein [Fibrobacteraceae bacterium]
MKTNKSYRVETVFTLLSPLSHIGESESTTSFLNTIRIMSQGKPVDCFAYNGNALRGMLRDHGASYMLDHLGNIGVPKKTFDLLFSGGAIGGTQSADIDQARAVRSALPFVSLFGGGIGNQILEGKMTQTFAYPVCAETIGIIPQGRNNIDYTAQNISWKKMTGEISFSRMDDAKHNLGDRYIVHEGEQLLLSGDVKPEKGKKEDNEPATQMRYTVEYMVPGTQLFHIFDLNCSDLELGAFVSAVHRWSSRPVLGGLSGKGFGQVRADMDLITDGERQKFMSIEGNQPVLGALAGSAKEQYDRHLESMYRNYLTTNEAQFVQLLEGTKK